MDKIKELDKEGVTKIFISHNFDSVQMLCKKTVYLSHGEIQYYGKTNQAVNKFKKASINFISVSIKIA